MSFVRTSAMFFALSAATLPALSQTATAAAPSTAPANGMAATNTYSALRDALADQTQVLSGDVMSQRAILRKNQELLKEAQRLEATNKRLLAEKQRMVQQNAELERQRAALAGAQPQVLPQPQATQFPTEAPQQLSTMAKATTADLKQ